MSNSPGFNMYAVTKHAVTALAESLRRELVQLETPVRVSVSRNCNATSPPTSPLVVSEQVLIISNNTRLLRYR
jgi:NAD(P)-dependent dehydrogenase (short-subunit alcohol dehydrogenase family)